METPFVTREQLEESDPRIPLPFPSLMMKTGIVTKTAHDLHQAFAWNEGFKEYFAIRRLLTHQS